MEKGFCPFFRTLKGLKYTAVVATATRNSTPGMPCFAFYFVRALATARNCTIFFTSIEVKVYFHVSLFYFHVSFSTSMKVFLLPDDWIGRTLLFYSRTGIIKRWKRGHAFTPCSQFDTPSHPKWAHTNYQNVDYCNYK